MKNKIQVIRVFSKDERLMKLDYTTEYRKQLDGWLDIKKFSSSSIIDNQLLILEKFKSTIKIDKSVGLIMIHEKFERLDQNERKNTLIETFPKDFSSIKLQALEVKQMESSMLEILTIATKDPIISELPSPNRMAHIIATLAPNKTMRYQSNYKYDSWGTRRGQRSYLEQDWIIQNLGLVDVVDFSMKEKEQVVLEIDKTVNERKILK
ncbi:hypothetical protein [Aureivirga sp. CE67]|uniref:hypothetical protein n=1 Tax=Aureivirga sp. CE67 TaxID=1788983 RepID=UPI0018CB548B|nr:hypothetical protein [Aureivirga sp. CE67]